MSYATTADVKARAGTLAKAWSNDSDVSDGDLERFVDQTSDELDAAIGGIGYTVPITDTVAVGALVGPNADFALLLAIDATWPGSTGEVQELRTMVASRCQAYSDAIRDKTLAALLYLGATSAGAAEGGASNYWTNDAVNYSYWSRFAERLSPQRYGFADPHGVPVEAGPEFVRNMRL